MQTVQFRYLLDYAEYVRYYDPAKFAITICCVDNVVVQSGHILLVTRKKQPGKGLLALPGGHVDPGEKFVDAAVRELKEETRIADEKGEIPPAMLKSFIRHNHFFDSPHRSLQGRVVTMAYYYDMPARKDMFKVKGDDDAEAAKWYKLGTLDPRQFHDDHYHIIQEMIRPTEI
jgi:bifunctional NMN adenylyltransferase/nudix hydrolase